MLISDWSSDVCSSDLAMAKVQADSQLRQAEGQRKMAEFQQKAVADEAKHNAEIEKLRQTNADTEAKLAKTDAEIDKLRAETAKILSSIGLDVRKQDWDEYEPAAAQKEKAIKDRKRVGQGKREE